MSWRDDYRQGSFRGVPFVTQSNQRSGGRRGELHEFPRRDKPWHEDLGRRARRFSLTVFVWGDDHRVQRDRLIDALEAEGPGTLIHPWDGDLSVAVADYTVTDDTDSGGLSTFEISFEESGAAPQAPVGVDTAGASTAAADAAQEALPAELDDSFSIEDVADFVETHAAEIVKYASVAASIAGGIAGGSFGSVLHGFQAAVAFLPANVQALVREPLRLAQATIGLVQTVRALGTGALARIAALSMLMRFGDDLKPVIGDTPARNRERANQDAYVELVRSAAAAELVRVIAETDFDSYDQAVATRDAIAELFDMRILSAADAGRDAAAARYALLMRAAVADITTRAGTLARSYRYTPARTEPVLVIANRLYGVGDGLADRAADIAARNRLQYPGFVPGGVALSVLEARSG